MQHKGQGSRAGRLVIELDHSHARDCRHHQLILLCHDGLEHLQIPTPVSKSLEALVACHDTRCKGTMYCARKPLTRSLPSPEHVVYWLPQPLI